MSTRLIASDLPARRLDEVTEGDLIFAAKPSPMLALLNAVGEPWRHVAVVIEKENTLVVGEVTGANRFGFRPLDKVIGDYEIVGTARPQLPSSCIRAATDWVGGWVGSAQLYPWDDVVILGLSLLARRVMAFEQIEELDTALRSVARSAPQESGPSMTCSAFVHEAFQVAGTGCALELDFESLGPLAAPSSVIPDLFSLDGDELSAALATVTVADLVAAYDGQADDSTYLHPASPDPLVEGIPDAGYVGHSKSHMSLAQLARTARVVYQVLREYSSSYALAQETDRDSRWVGPGDLWRSNALGERTLLATDGKAAA